MAKYYKNIVEILEEIARKYPEKVAIEDEKQSINYSGLFNESIYLATQIHSILDVKNEPIGIYIEQSVSSIIAMFAILYSGNYYCVLDTKSPKDRLQRISKALKPSIIITDSETVNSNNEINDLADHIIVYTKEERNNIKEQNYWKEICDIDPAYILFTSGSTGVPKGSVISHKSVIAYSESIKRAFHIDDRTVFGNQTPFYFSMSVLDIFSTIYNASRLVIIPKKYFMFPYNLIEYMNERGINTIYWVPTAYNICVKRKVFNKIKPNALRLALFAGETMHSSCIRYWQDNLENVTYANLFGPTEITDTGLYYILERKYEATENIPIGKPFDNCDVFVLDENGKVIDSQNSIAEGELYYRGSFVGQGYFGQKETTKKSFVQNPLNNKYVELVFRSGDRVKYDQDGNLLFLGRIDNQIKINGYRIELGEIERMAGALEGISECVAIFDGKIISLYYAGQNDVDLIKEKLHVYLPLYMIPQRIIKCAYLPKNANGKIDRKKISEGELR